MTTPKSILALERAVQLLGNQTALAEAVGVKQPSVNYMLRSGRRVPAEWCLKIEQATGGAVSRHDLRPDLYPEHRPASPACEALAGEVVVAGPRASEDRRGKE